MRDRCPKCHQPALELYRTQRTPAGALLRARRLWRCSNCGHRAQSFDALSSIPLRPGGWRHGKRTDKSLVTDPTAPPNPEPDKT